MRGRIVGEGFHSLGTVPIPRLLRGDRFHSGAREIPCWRAAINGRHLPRAAFRPMCCAWVLVRSCFVRIEYLFDRQFEQLGNVKGQRQAGIVFAAFYGVDRLPRDAQLFAEGCLRPTAFRAELPQAGIQFRKRLQARRKLI